MVILDANRRTMPVPPLAAWSLDMGIIAAIGANLAHGLGYGANRCPGQRLARCSTRWVVRAVHARHKASAQTKTESAVSGAERASSPVTEPDLSSAPIDALSLK